MSQRLSFPDPPTRPVVIKKENVPKILWGDEISRPVPDWLYCHTSKIHTVIFQLQPGGYWKYSPKLASKPVYEADVCCYVLEGALANHDPETGEVKLAKKGEVVYFRKNTWWFGYDASGGGSRVLEWMAPPSPSFPAVSPCESPTASKNALAEMIGSWPMKNRDYETNKFFILKQSDQLHIIQGQNDPILVSFFVSSDLLSVGSFMLAPGRNGDAEFHGGDESLYVERGKLDIFFPRSRERFEVEEEDGFFCPEGIEHQYYNTTELPVHALFAIAPNYFGV